MATRVVYLFGAGASHACVKRVGSTHGILMGDLTGSLQIRLHALIENGFAGIDSLEQLVNSVDEKTDVEHLITFLDDVPSSKHREFAAEMRIAFEEVLREKLELIRDETQGDPIELYQVLLDIHNMDQFPESLHGVMTINYDEYIEAAIEQVWNCSVDFGIRVEPLSENAGSPKFLKLHGSFGWQDTLPISRGDNRDATLWIPPGIQKAKQAYPFNVLWGSAREMLACDILRVVGCRLGPNDWDLISLLFTMRHANMAHRPQIEIIDAPEHADRLKSSYPYLDVLSILDVEPVGSRLINELTGKALKRFANFDEDEQQEILMSMSGNRNWFELWLTQIVEHYFEEGWSTSTSGGFVDKFLSA